MIFSPTLFGLRNSAYILQVCKTFIYKDGENIIVTSKYQIIRWWWYPMVSLSNIVIALAILDFSALLLVHTVQLSLLTFLALSLVSVLWLFSLLLLLQISLFVDIRSERDFFLLLCAIVFKCKSQRQLLLSQ